nr:MAG TPA: hypothetical protein [Caudoviricetes sp.]
MFSLNVYYYTPIISENIDLGQENEIFMIFYYLKYA